MNKLEAQSRNLSPIFNRVTLLTSWLEYCSPGFRSHLIRVINRDLKLIEALNNEL